MRALPQPLLLIALFCASVGHVGCSGDAVSDAQRRIVSIDGSSTVYPMSEAVAEEFQRTHQARITIGISGTGGGFKKFCSGETSITGASRPIKPTEVELCAAAGVDWIELPVASDGIAVVVNPDNDWVDHMTVEELRLLWRPEAQGQVVQWSDIRDGWPEEEIHLYGPGVDSGTYDYFTRAVVGTEHASRGDVTSSEDDNVLVQGITNDRLALGFFGYGYYEENQDRLQIVPIDDEDGNNGTGPVAPSAQTVRNGTYQPLARPVFIYTSREASERPEVETFVSYYLREVGGLAAEVGYIPLPENTYSLVSARYGDRTPGSMFEGDGTIVGADLDSLLGGR